MKIEFSLNDDHDGDPISVTVAGNRQDGRVQFIVKRVAYCAVKAALDFGLTLTIRELDGAAA